MHKLWIQSNVFKWKYSIFRKLSTISWVFKKISSPTAAVIVAFTVPEIKKTKNFIKLEYISYTMTLDCNNLNSLATLIIQFIYFFTMKNEQINRWKWVTGEITCWEKYQVPQLRKSLFWEEFRGLRWPESHYSKVQDSLNVSYGSSKFSFVFL